MFICIKILFELDYLGIIMKKIRSTINTIAEVFLAQNGGIDEKKEEKPKDKEKDND